MNMVYGILVSVVALAVIALTFWALDRLDSVARDPKAGSLAALVSNSHVCSDLFRDGFPVCLEP